MLERGSDLDAVVGSRLSGVKRWEVDDFTLDELCLSVVLIGANSEAAVLSSTKDGLADHFVFLREGVVDDSNSGLVVDGDSDQDGDGWEVVLDEVRGSIKRVNPDDSILGVELLEVAIEANLVISVNGSQSVGDPLATLSLLGV